MRDFGHWQLELCCWWLLLPSGPKAVDAELALKFMEMGHRIGLGEYAEAVEMCREKKPLTFLSLFAGIGGLDLGLERAGMKCIGQVEIDPFCRKVLAKHWPDVPKFEDVKTFHAGMLNEKPDVICGGFPCQDISNAGKRAGIDGERSGLWSEFHRIICEVRPRYVLVENVAALLVRGVERVLGDLAASGFDAEWDCISAESVGAPHIRNRLFLVGHASGPGAGDQHTENRGQEWRDADASKSATLRPTRGPTCSGRSDSASEDVPNANESGRGLGQHKVSTRKLNAVGRGETIPDTKGVGSELRPAEAERPRRFAGCGFTGVFSDADRESLGRIAESRGQRGEWATEPDVGRVAHGIPARVDRLKGLGNAVVPQVAEFIGRRIVEASAAP